MTGRTRIPEWESRRALALYLFDHSPVTAQFAGEMSHKLARILDKTTDKVVAWSPGSALPIAQSLEATGHVAIERTGESANSTIVKVSWIGQTDPSIIEWEPPRPPKPEPTGRIARLEAQVAELQAKVDRVPELIRQAVDLAMEAWIR